MTFWMKQNTESYFIELVKLPIFQKKKVQYIVVGGRWDGKLHDGASWKQIKCT